MHIPVAFVDANVLYSKTLRDWLFLLRIETGGRMFALFSSEDTLTETLYHLRKNKADAPGRYTGAIQERIRASLDDIVDDFPAIDFPGADDHDQHIHAAATSVNASYLIAGDRGFHDIDGDLLPYEVHSADSFFMLVAANAPGAVDRVITRQIGYYGKRSQSAKLDAMLEKAGCSTFAVCVRGHLAQLAADAATHGVSDRLLPTEPAP
ncbi:PIN domain-containing protein [Paramicrobacterium fandaimingii]|uniref:PIN domain-containing protein n=1 Tax=Paramicrobacterium fandaimingii TaxID=2708079 RepID=UPI001420A94F|nr:PIN domain-containing protein [Microbacterium fandaimingii]